MRRSSRAKRKPHGRDAPVGVTSALTAHEVQCDNSTNDDIKHPPTSSFPSSLHSLSRSSPFIHCLIFPFIRFIIFSIPFLILSFLRFPPSLIMSRLLALLVTVLALLCMLTNGQSPAQLEAANDLTVLNYALTLENLENNFYAMGLAKFNSPAPFVAAGMNASVFSYIQMVSSHEASHVAFLTAAINSVVANAAVPNCTYDFSAAMVNVSTFIATAAILENTGQTAYDGAINGISNPDYAQVAAQIATVEARHAAYLNELVGASPFPRAFDIANLPSAIAAAIAPFLVHCPYNIMLPTVRPEGVALNATTGQIIVTGSITSATYTAAQQTNDIVALNYGLTLENFEAAFYQYILHTFSPTDFAAAGLPAYYYNYTQMIAGHELLHASTLTTVINQRVPGAAVPVCIYNFGGITTLTGPYPTGYLAVAQVLENTGVMAYDGAAKTITDTNLQQVAATIATVEARHAAFLNQANHDSPFPSSQDSGQNGTVILAAVLGTGLITSCPYTPVGPSLLPLSLSTPTTSVLGDPAFVGFHGQSFQVHGIPSRHFNLLSTPTIQFNALFKMIEDGEAMTAGQMRQTRIMREIQSSSKLSAAHVLPITTAFSHAGTFLGEMGLKLSQVAKVRAVAGAYTKGFELVELNGVPMEVNSIPVKVAEGAYVTFPNPHTIQVDTAMVSFTLINSDGFFNIEQATLNGAFTDDMQMEGLLGQTANPEWKVLNTKEFKTHMVMDYLLASKDIFSDDFVSNLYPLADVQ